METETDQYPSSLSTKQNIVLEWFDPRNRGLGMIAFILNRITAIGLVVYLAIHLVVLSLLAFGENSWDAFITIARSPLLLVLDIILIAGVLIHGLNGVRLTLIGMGIAVNQQKLLFVILMVITVGILILAGIGIFTV